MVQNGLDFILHASLHSDIYFKFTDSSSSKLGPEATRNRNRVSEVGGCALEQHELHFVPRVVSGQHIFYC